MSLANYPSCKLGGFSELLADSFCFRDRKWLKAFPIGLHPHFYDLFVIQIIEIFFFKRRMNGIELATFCIISEQMLIVGYGNTGCGVFKGGIQN